MNSNAYNMLLSKRFNLIEKVKESEVFGILVGTLSMDKLNNVLNEIKMTLSLNNKKFYTLLLGKITEEKLANFVFYIDCFILIACPFSKHYTNRATLKPIVSPLDVKMAYDAVNYKWDLKYSFDPNYILDNANINEGNDDNDYSDKSKNKLKQESLDDNNPLLKFETSLKLNE